MDTEGTGQGRSSGGRSSGGHGGTVNTDTGTEQQQLDARMKDIKHKVLVLSGKGGVGKSTVAVNLAVALALAGKKTGLLDIDIHGPSVPNLLGIKNAQVMGSETGLIPVTTKYDLKVMSIGFLLQDQDVPTIWRGPRKHGVIKQFIKDVEWGQLDYLIIDSPPGTGDEPLSIAQLIEDATGAVIVTTPQEIAIIDVRKCISFCREVDVPVLGVVENMSGFVCPKCGETVDIFKTGGGKKMAEEMNVKFLGKIPLDPDIVDASDSGKVYVETFAHSETAKAFLKVIKPLLELGIPAKKDSAEKPIITEDKTLKETDSTEANGIRIAMPVAQGQLCLHFGHCEQFALIDADPASKTINKEEYVDAPGHQPGLLPKWLAERGATVIIAGGMGMRAQSLFAENGITVVIGATPGSPIEAAKAYLDGTLQTGDNICDH
jgi:Mrp family chromosome partitioning ATPase/predicted Fe-Mo cluster-binding NifX family protein